MVGANVEGVDGEGTKVIRGGGANAEGGGGLIRCEGMKICEIIIFLTSCSHIY